MAENQAFIVESINNCRLRGMTWEQLSQHVGMDGARELLRWRHLVQYVDPLRNENQEEYDQDILETVKELRDLHCNWTFIAKELNVEYE